MKDSIKQFKSEWKNNFHFKSFASSAVSSLFDILFALFNGFLGIYLSSVWNGAICVYYALLATIQIIIVNSQKNQSLYENSDKEKYQKKIYKTTHIIIFILNLSLIGPIQLMIQGEKTYNFGIIPAITIATFTFYKITVSIIHYRKSKKIKNIFVQEIRTINLIDSLVAILTLQNTMILANDAEITGSMKTLSIITSTIIWCIILALSIISLINSKK